MTIMTKFSVKNYREPIGKFKEINIVSDKLPPKILVIEPDLTLNANVCNAIERYWFDVIRTSDADAALRISEINPPNMAIISSRIKDMSAIEISVKLRKIAELQDLPLLFLIEKDEPESNYNLPNSGYMELLHRPFTPNELMISIRSILRKSKPVFQDKIIGYDDIKMDLSTYQVFRGDKRVHLGPTEFKILQLLVLKPKNIYSRRQIIDYVWGADKEIAPRTIDVHINRIRTMMKEEKDKHLLIKTIRAAGYCLD
ncbi:MAG: two-component system response regulator [Rickettsiales bacterium]|nr:MAG: two-component system response regulator [Rickettsiales bacterium]